MEENRFRCHISIILKQLLPMAALFVVLAADNIEDVLRYIQEGSWTPDKSIGVVCGVLLLMIIYSIYALILWAKTWIILDEKSLVIERNTFFRKVQTIGLENVTNVNLTQNLLQRLLHVYVVKLDTNSATTADETDVHIALKEDKALWFRGRILNRCGQEGMNTSEEIAKGEGSMLHYSFGALLFRWFFMCNIIGAVILALIPFVTLLVEKGGVLTTAILWLGVLFSLIGGLFRYYGFRADRKGDELEVSYGFFSRREYRIPVDKISAIRIRQKLHARWTGRKTVELICIGLGDDAKEGTQLILAEKEEKLLSYMDKLLPEYADEVRHSLTGQKNVVWLSYIFGIIGMAGVLGAVVIGAYLIEPKRLVYELTAAAAGMTFLLVCKVSGFFAKKIAAAEECLIVADGCFEIRTLCVPYHNIQYFAMKNGPVMEHYGQCKGEVHVLASTLESVYPIGYFDKTLMEEVHRKMLSVR